MQHRDEDDNKAKAFRSQFDLCQRLAQETGDPELAEKLRNLAKKLQTQATAQNAA
jgi:monomeric isocitrate dehydrogenase